ncbi:Zn(2)-C6 fungal-type domain-containing protein [Mycena indigotica]|uniref:Zn(2)-C6 fungal-type domain-containing protein n=1 Tax=Mycena indigotica TaxID=2126181 RepID=A0A8H6VWK3_9AGAR|nr:Zn(2)-C6 fungal-type domain-containing protein [Mycena indigotica]KAF7294571.1 Zn(2)-C6 fungal-type domain-containing protein [Mycena indigotica]
MGNYPISGNHSTDGFTANALVIIDDHTYLELLSFTHPADSYPPSSPRHQHKWAARAPGWIDYAFLGNGILDEGPQRISDVINGRWRRETKLYNEEVGGGRTREDGVKLEWVISAPAENHGLLPFFCGDVTDRQLRVPTRPDSNTTHPSGARGVAHIRILVKSDEFQLVADQLSAVIDAKPFERLEGTAKWHLSTLNGLRSPTLVVSIPESGEEEDFLRENTEPNIYEVAFWVGEKGKLGSVLSPFGRIVWVK